MAFVYRGGAHIVCRCCEKSVEWAQDETKNGKWYILRVSTQYSLGFLHREAGVISTRAAPCCALVPAFLLESLVVRGLV